MTPTRRQLLGFGLAAAPFFFLPQIALARAATDKRFVMIILRGAMDGITAVAPVGDPEYARARGDLAVAGPATIGGMFAIHPALVETTAMYNAKEALFVHAVASPYRDRSHFDGQNVLETGGTSPYELKDGWMNRLLPLLPAGQRALAVASAVPPILRGRVGVESYAPSNLGEPTDDLLHRVGLMYAGDPVLHPMWDAAIEARRIAAETGAPVAAAMPTLGAGAPAGMATMTSVTPVVARPAPTSAPRRNGNRNLPGLAALAAQFLAKPDGARIAVLELDGWDTHSGQQGRLTNQLKQLDAALAALKTGLGPAWADTVVLCATEFGRTVHANGTGGTDHGTASLAILAGGGVAGGKVIADWPGLGQGARYEGRDVKPTADLRGVLLAASAAHMGVDPARAARALFPDAAGLRATGGVLRG